MLAKSKMQEIQDLKLQGYTKTDIIRYYESQGGEQAQPIAQKGKIPCI